MGLLARLARLLRRRRGGGWIEPTPEEREIAAKVVASLEEGDEISRIESRLEALKREVERLRERLRGGG